MKFVVIALLTGGLLGCVVEEETDALEQEGLMEVPADDIHQDEGVSGPPTVIPAQNKTAKPIHVIGMPEAAGIDGESAKPIHSIGSTGAPQILVND